MRSTLLVTLLAATAAAASLAAAPQAPGPRPEMARFEPLLGNWEGGGTFVPEPDMETSWHARSTVKRILGGHFVQEDMVVDAGMPAAFVFRNIYGWDAARQQYVVFTMNNMQGVHAGTAWLTPDGGIVQTGTMHEGAMVATEQWLTRVDGDVSTTEAWRSENGGAFRKYLEGEMHRGGDGFDATAAPVEAAGEPHEALGDLAAQLGTWRLEGKVEPMPGMPMMEVAATETIREVMGGHVHFSDIHGDPMPGAPQSFHGQVYAGWSPLDHSLLWLSLDNFGGWTVERGRKEGDIFVFTWEGELYGLPAVTRTILKMQGPDKLYMRSERMASSMPPSVSFEAEFTRVQKTRKL